MIIGDAEAFAKLWNGDGNAIRVRQTVDGERVVRFPASQHRTQDSRSQRERLFSYLRCTPKRDIDEFPKLVKKGIDSGVDIVYNVYSEGHKKGDNRRNDKDNR